MNSNSNLKCIHIIPNLVQNWMWLTILERQFTDIWLLFFLSSSSLSVNNCYCESYHELDHSKAGYTALMLGGSSYNFESTPMRAFLIGWSKFGGIVASLSVEKFRPLHHSPYTKASIQRCLLRRSLKKVIIRFNAKNVSFLAAFSS